MNSVASFACAPWTGAALSLKWSRNLICLHRQGAAHTQKRAACSITFCLKPRPLFHNQQVGDWGRGGTANQRLVAALMGRQAERCYKPSFIISTGDNFVSVVDAAQEGAIGCLCDAAVPKSVREGSPSMCD